MKVKTLEISTRGNADAINLTEKIEDFIREANLKEGLLNVFVEGSTAALMTIEYEPNLIIDLQEFFDRIVPKDMPYKHHETWNDDNGHSHIRASLVGPSLMIPVIEGKLKLGTWQQIVLIDFDTSPRKRNIYLSFLD